MISPTKTIQIIFLYSLVAALHDVAHAGFPYKICSNSYYASDSPFRSNLNNLFDSLRSNASSNNFSYTSSGNGSDRVYGLYMCLTYVTYETCGNCITNASQNIVKLCANQKEAGIWENSCQRRYSNDDFFGRVDVTGNIPIYNRLNVSEIPAERFRSIVNSTLSNLTKFAAFGPSTNMYATAKVPFADKDTLYAVAQCTKGLSPADCNTCLQTAISNISSYVSRGATLLSRSCFMRYEVYAFFEGAAESEAPVSDGSQSTRKGNYSTKIRVTIIVTVIGILLVVLASTIYFSKKVDQKRKGQVRVQYHFPQIGYTNNTNFYHQHIGGRDDLKAEEFYIDLKTIQAATNNFSDSNLIGQGGFGIVYKGVWRDGKEVAVKRLSSCSEQGIEQFSNEVLLIVRLQHKNLVRLLGFCADGDEKLLVYEFMPNNSLDIFLFDPVKRVQLNWSRRLNIINGVAKGILYLHENSRFKIIHRDLKASNVLLDFNMNPKISDFGMARIFAGSEGEASTTRIVGTYGYMAPEYAMRGLYSTRSDVFRLVVLLLEILTGRRNTGGHQSKSTPCLVAYAWKLWNEGTALELMDPLLTNTCSPDIFLRYIRFALLCVQENAFDRPTMSSVFLMLKGERVTLRQPQRPAFFSGTITNLDEINAKTFSVNPLTISDVSPR